VIVALRLQDGSVAANECVALEKIVPVHFGRLGCMPKFNLRYLLCAMGFIAGILVAIHSLTRPDPLEGIVAVIVGTVIWECRKPKTPKRKPL